MACKAGKPAQFLTYHDKYKYEARLLSYSS